MSGFESRRGRLGFMIMDSLWNLCELTPCWPANVYNNIGQKKIISHYQSTPQMESY